MKIIVEAGGTKCKWGLIDNQIRTVETIGFNPNCGHPDGLLGIAQAVAEVAKKESDTVLYFGAGCGNQQNQELVRSTLKKVFTNAEIKVCSDLEGAAIALFGDQQGIAAILGTGAAAGYYNGKAIEHQAPSLGYLLGDEGSGTYIGKTLIAKVLRNELSADLCNRFFDFAQTTPVELIKNVYSAQPVNAYLAKFVQFTSENISEPEITKLVADAFELFHQKHIEPLNINNLPIGFVGGVAWQFADILQAQYAKRGIEIVILKDAFARLCELHGA